MDVHCGIPGLSALISSEVAKQGFYLSTQASIKLVIDVPQGTALQVLEFSKSPMRRGLQFVVLTFSTCAEYWEDLWDLQPAALLVATNHNFDFANLIHPAARGERYRSAPSRVTTLNQSERQLIRHVARGFSNKEIAQQLGLQEKTVMNSLTAIYKKLNLNSRSEAILHYWGIRPGIPWPSNSAAQTLQPVLSLPPHVEAESWDKYPVRAGYSSLTND